jgi:hypothetical protein
MPRIARIRADIVSVEIRQIRAIRVLRRGNSALCASKLKPTQQSSLEQNTPLTKTQTPALHLLQIPPCPSYPASRETKARLPAKCPGSRDPEHRRTGRRPGMMRYYGHPYALILMWSGCKGAYRRRGRSCPFSTFSSGWWQRLF